MIDHPTPAELESFVWNRMTAPRVREVVAHLVRGCEQCRAELSVHLDGRLGDEPPAEPVLSPSLEDEYDAALDRAYVATLKKLAEIGEAKKREALALLVASAPQELHEIPDHLHGMPLFEALIERSWELRHEDPDEMLRLAEWALLIAHKYDFPFMSTKQLADLRCRAWIEIGNAYRVADDLAEAEDALTRATHLFLEGTENEHLAARLFDIQASLYAALRRFGVAQGALGVVLAIQTRFGNDHLVGRALISKGMCVGYQGEAEEAIRLITRGLELVDEGREPRLVFFALHNQIRLLVDCGRLRDARMAILKLRSSGLNPGGRINELKVRWLEGQILVATGDLESAEEILLEVKQGFDEAGLGYKAALVALELGAVALRQGHTGEAAKEVVQAADVFIAVGVRRETRAAVLLLKNSFEKQANAVLLDHVIWLLRHADETSEAQLDPMDDS